jgi:hypothetical protein
VFEKTVATFGTFALLYTVTEAFILPLTPTPDQSFARSLLDLALPFMVAYLLVFYLIFGTYPSLPVQEVDADPPIIRTQSASATPSPSSPSK